MDDATKAVLAGWVRHLIGLAAGAGGLEAWLNPDLTNGIVALVLTVIAFGWSTLAKRIAPVEEQYDPNRTSN